uniref:Uncharacterized protein n=1 Tax=Helianthus annuus TaxID=4232 RepID=A0A251TAB9_HELAN
MNFKKLLLSYLPYFWVLFLVVFKTRKIKNLQQSTGKISPFLPVVEVAVDKESIDILARDTRFGMLEEMVRDKEH